MLGRFVQLQRDAQGNIVPLARPQNLGGFTSAPTWDRNKGAGHTRRLPGTFYPPIANAPPGASFAPPQPGPGAPLMQDWRIPNLNNFINLTIAPSFINAVLPVDYHRCYVAVQNLDAIATILLTFSAPPNAAGTNAINITPGLGFIIDYACPYSPLYVAAAGAFTVPPSCMFGTQVAPSTLPPNP